MRLLSIKLNNIGLYKNELIEFPYGDKNNIIVFWGNNGAGKTTLINSVKVGLLGKDAVQMSYSEYCQFVKTKLISTRCDLHNAKASIEVDFEINDSNNKEVYKIVRQWRESPIFAEDDFIYKCDVEVVGDDKDYIKNLIAKSLPPSLLDVIIFDGENAINILNEGKMNKLIKEILYSVFGMDVYSALSKDLSLFLRSAKSNSDVSTYDQMSLIKLESDYKYTLKNSNKFETIVEGLNKNKINKLRDINFLLKRFADKTGINVSNLEELNKNISHANSNKERLNSDLKYINEEILPLKLVHKRIKDIIAEIDKNEPYKATVHLKKLKEFFSDKDEAKIWLEKLSSLLPQDEIDVRYDVSESELSIIKKIDAVLSNYSKKRMLEVIENKKDYLKEIRNQISISNKVASKEAKDILEKLEVQYDELDEINSSLSQIQLEMDRAKSVLSEAKEKYDVFKSELLKQKKESSSYVTALKYRESIDEFIELNVKDICSNLNKKLLQYLQDMKFRNDSIGDVEINPKTFDINLYEKNGKLISTFLFSAGEKQVLLGLVIKAAISLSGIDCFFLFDTPVGRLDKRNREIFTKKVIFSVSNQSFIFATDSDYSEDDYKMIKSSITSEFMLKRNDNDEIIAVKGSLY